MAKTTATSRVLRSIVSPSLGISISALAIAGACAVGCDKPPANGGTSTDDSGKVPYVGIVAQDRGPQPEPVETTTVPADSATGSVMALPTSSAAAAPTASALAAPTASAAVNPKPTASPQPTHTTARPGVRVPLPGKPVAPGVRIPAPGKVAAPGLAPSGAPNVVVEARPTRVERRVTDLDRRALRRGLVLDPASGSSSSGARRLV